MSIAEFVCFPFANQRQVDKPARVQKRRSEKARRRGQDEGRGCMQGKVVCLRVTTQVVASCPSNGWRISVLERRKQSNKSAGACFVPAAFENATHTEIDSTPLWNALSPIVCMLLLTHTYFNLFVSTNFFYRCFCLRNRNAQAAQRSLKNSLSCSLCQ